MLYHYTSRDRLSLIRQSGELQPCSPRISYDFKNAQEGGYIYALLDHPQHHGWVVTELLDLLLLRNAAYVLEFKMKNPEIVLVREAYYLSPDNMVASCGVNLWDLFSRGKISATQFGRRKPYLDYLRSTIAFDQYDESYIAPEIMVPYSVPLAEIKIIPRA